MILYHASTRKNRKPNIASCEIGRDFGNGFYTTDFFAQAKRSAIQTQIIANRTIQPAKAVVNSYLFDFGNAEKALKVKYFKEPDIEWLNFIIQCRKFPTYFHGFDIVMGRIANDNVGETVSLVMEGIMRKEDAIIRLRFQQINNQICFNTNRALRFLQFIDAEEL